MNLKKINKKELSLSEREVLRELEKILDDLVFQMQKKGNLNIAEKIGKRKKGK